MCAKTSGQSTLEYAAVAAIVAAALLTMQVYVKRGVAGRLRASADSIGEAYDPRHATTDMTLTVSSRSTVTQTLQKNAPNPGGGEGDVMETISTVDDTTSRAGEETVGRLTDSLWD